MTREETIALAREAGFEEGSGAYRGSLFNPYTADEFPLDKELERFAALVAAHEREECAKVVESLAGAQWVTREASLECSDAIRARGNQ